VTTDMLEVPRDFARFGPVQLHVVDGERSLGFWRDVVGLRLRSRDDAALELGTEDETLIVLRPGATGPTRRGYTGLYHVAIHLPNEPEFARVLARLIERRWRVGPTDHVMSKAIYLTDPDGIGLELTLETPERQRSIRVLGTHIEITDSDGRMRSGRDPLDVEQLLAQLPDTDVERPVPLGTTVGHMHLHVDDLDAAFRFYRDVLGFVEHLYLPQMGSADLHAGGRFPHRLAVNVWQGAGAPPPPAGTAGLRSYTIRYDSPARLNAVLQRVPDARRDADDSGHDGTGYWIADPAGNAIRLTA
jgi:catechol 2,3-dioxygenase